MVQRNLHWQTAECLVRIVQAVVAESHEPMSSLRHRLDAASRIRARDEESIEVARLFVVAGKCVGEIFEIDERASERVVVVGGFDANFGWQRDSIRPFRAAGEKNEQGEYQYWAHKRCVDLGDWESLET